MWVAQPKSVARIAASTLGIIPSRITPCASSSASSRRVELADQRALRVADTLDVGHEDELAGVQCDRELRGDGVRVDVVGLPVVAEPDRRHHRDASLVEDRHDRLAVHLRDLADEAEVGAARVGARPHQQRRSVLAGQARSRRRRACGCARRCRGPTLPVSTIFAISMVGASVTRSPLTNFVSMPMRSCHALISDPPPCTITGFMPTKRSSTMSSSTESRSPATARGAADLHHEDVARETLDVRQCLDEHLGTLDPFVDGLFWHVSLSCRLRVRWCSRR